MDSCTIRMSSISSPLVVCTSLAYHWRTIRDRPRSLVSRENEVLMPTLDERFSAGPPTREPADAHAWLSAEERRFILWGLKEQWSALRIGRALGVNEATVRRFRKRFWEEPRLLLELGLYEMVGSARTPEYRSLVCGERVLGRLATERHVLRHYWEEAVVMATLPEVASNSAHQSQGQEGGEKRKPELRSMARRRRRRL